MEVEIENRRLFHITLTDEEMSLLAGLSSMDVEDELSTALGTAMSKDNREIVFKAIGIVSDITRFADRDEPMPGLEPVLMNIHTDGTTGPVIDSSVRARVQEDNSGLVGPWVERE